MLAKWPAFRDRLNERVAKSPVGRWFKLEGCGHALARPGARFTTEMRAGLVTYAAMAYILSLNASIVSATGGPCTADAGVDRTTDPTYQACVQRVNQEYVVVTAALGCLATGLVGLWSNLPLGLAPGLGVNAYFASLVGQNGSGSIPYGQALAAVFVEGFIFFGLSLIGLRQWLGRLMPRSLTLATGVGIGLYLAFIGIGPNGVGVMGGSQFDLVGLGGCKPEDKDEGGFCNNMVLRLPTMWVGIFCSGVFTALLLIFRVRGAFLWPILFCAIISWPRNTEISQFPHTARGDAGFAFFSQVATWTPLDLLGPKNIDWSGFGDGKVWIALISFLYIDALDTTGTMVAMSRQAGLYDEVHNDFEGSSTAFLADSLAISMGALMGSSPSTAFIESAAGIAEGGKTGLSALMTSFLFFISLFFAPIFASIPAWATGCTLIIVGSMMASNAVAINWAYHGDAIPAFILIIGIPFFHNIAYGLIAGVCTFIVLHNVPLLLGAIHPSLKPPGHDTLKEPYSIVSTMSTSPSGVGRAKEGLAGFLPPWLRKAVRGNKTFWKMTDAEIAAALEGRRITALRTAARTAQAERERAELRQVMFQGPQEGGFHDENDVVELGGAVGGGKDVDSDDLHAEKDHTAQGSPVSYA